MGEQSMAHKSKKKHIKHMHEHELAAAPRTSTRAKAKQEIDEGRSRKPGTKPERATSSKTKKKGIVRSIAKAAGKKLAARPKRVIARVKSMLGR
jgi:hypothetical protein